MFPGTNNVVRNSPINEYGNPFIQPIAEHPPPTLVYATPFVHHLGAMHPPHPIPQYSAFMYPTPFRYPLHETYKLPVRTTELFSMYSNPSPYPPLSHPNLYNLRFL